MQIRQKLSIRSSSEKIPIPTLNTSTGMLKDINTKSSQQIYEATEEQSWTEEEESEDES
jgi:hypothetical protein